MCVRDSSKKEDRSARFWARWRWSAITEFYCQRNPKRRMNNKRKKKNTERTTTNREIYKSFSFIHLIAVFGIFFLSTFRSFYWFESAKKLILVVIFRFFFGVSGCDDNKFDHFIGVSVFLPWLLFLSFFFVISQLIQFIHFVRRFGQHLQLGKVLLNY